MVKAIYNVPHTLADPIVHDGIRAINAAKEAKELGGFIAGGIAVQSYLPHEAYRKTVDLDFRLLWGGGVGDFRGITEPLREHLQSLGYAVNFHKQNLTYDHLAQKNGDSLVIQHQQNSSKRFERIRKSLEREVANARTVFKGETSYSALSPEDLVATKLSRFLIFSRKFGIDLPADVGKYTLEELRTTADNIKDGILSNIGEASSEELERIVARLRIYYDCFDIKSLATYAGLNKGYFDEVVKNHP